MQPFLIFIKQRFWKTGLPSELWGDELGEYLDEDALHCWTDLQQSGTGKTDWSLVKQELVKRFCTVDLATLTKWQLANGLRTAAPILLTSDESRFGEPSCRQKT